MVMESKVVEITRRGSAGVCFGADGDSASAAMRMGERADDRRRKRLEQLRFVEQRLRPLRGTPLEHVYWRVHGELVQLGEVRNVT